MKLKLLITGAAAAVAVAVSAFAAGHEPTVTHRNLDSAPQDGLEGKPPPASPAPGGQT